MTDHLDLGIRISTSPEHEGYTVRARFRSKEEEEEETMISRAVVAQRLAPWKRNHSLGTGAPLAPMFMHLSLYGHRARDMSTPSVGLAPGRAGALVLAQATKY
ncbi:hypothetical protein GGTG_00714 [Gaeumannomyces tritici R3-111a-1]|uniref:Uncharacterized protein n=1 Tax=Gaeumannomyces tritici (strain R3-111a-1) TaxID=644352 RepID=J3NHH7_GAET3|nr:hypothetical protein GGTG_00714 [Gaeumannomyces tritici R3-111a-1]EJT80720.1 hypothetical protein GGTG_00714 [Gaeumannomyces tritici R3-111a-1]